MKNQLILLTIFLFTNMTACQNQEKTHLIVFAAGSLITPFNALEKSFESRYPRIDVQNEFHGSIQVIRHVTEIHELIDIVATADHALLPMLMYENNIPETDESYSNWYIRFASNRVGLAFTDKSKYSNVINEKNWFEIISRPDVKIGLSDPRFDALGYRELMVLKLSEDYYSKYSIFNDVMGGVFTIPISAIWEDDLAVITVPEILEVKENKKIVLRGSSIQLIALLEAGEVDYTFEYESVIRQHDLRMVHMPKELNLGEEEKETNYENVIVKLDFQRFASIEPEFKGERIGYGITIPNNAPHPQQAELFIDFLLSPDGQMIMEENFHPLLDPLIIDNYQNLPISLQKKINHQ